jgi:hypothetical protein
MLMHKRIGFILLIWLSSPFAQKTPVPVSQGYYGKEFVELMSSQRAPTNPRLPSPGSINPEQLRKTLFDILSKAHVINPTTGFDSIVATCESASCRKHKALDYSAARTVIFKLHPGSKNTSSNTLVVHDIYCQKDYSYDVNSSGQTNMTLVNIEHTWPQSKFNKAYLPDYQKSDLHHLYPSLAKLNSIRGNFPFGEVDHIDIDYPGCNDAYMGSSPDGRSQVFQPPVVHKGNVARSLFYFSIRYQIALDPKQEAVLREWNKSDPADEAEKVRNQKIMEIQGDRNPFIDFPGLANLISDF